MTGLATDQPDMIREMRALALTVHDVRLVAACDRALHWGDPAMLARVLHGRPQGAGVANLVNPIPLHPNRTHP